MLKREPQHKKSVCIATPDIIGPTRNGGIGTACFEIAKLWRRAGHDVTVLYVNHHGFMEAKDLGWKKAYDELGIEFVMCPEDTRRGLSEILQRTWNAWQWLRQRTFDAIYFPEWGAVGLYAIQAKRAGLDFATTTMMVGTHSPTNWHSSGGMMFPRSLQEIMMDAAERQCVAECDVVVSPSAYMIDYLREQGWRLPGDVRVVPNPFPAESLPLSQERHPVTEIVFFGRLEQRKGLEIFVRALGRLPADVAAGLKITFLGKAGEMPGGALSYIEANRVEAFADWKVIDALDARDALDYLSEPGRLAIMASRIDNSPMTVRECLALGIPFLASAVGGIPELIAPEMHDELLFEPRPASLRSHILRAVEEGARLGRAAFDEPSVTAGWLNALEVETAVQIPEDIPKVSVVVTTFNRPDLLEEAIEGLRQQSWKNLEVVLVDDGSTSAAALAKLDSLASEFAAAGWKIVRQENAYLGAARNTGWRAATGDLVIFHDDDNYSSPDLVETYVRALAVSGADIATCTMAPFVSARPQGPSSNSPRVFGYVGDAAGAGLISNYFGDAHACFTRAALEKIGGFTEDYGVGHEDWEIFAHGTLMGLRIQYVPKPLFWYRESSDSMLRSRRAVDPDYMRSLRPYLAAVPASLRPVLEYLAYLSLRTSVLDTTEANLEALCLAPYPPALRDESVLRAVCEGRFTTLELLRRTGLSYSALGIIRRLRRIGAKHEAMGFNQLVIAALPRKARGTRRVVDIATFRQSWERAVLRHPTRVSYWLAARAIQREARRLRWEKERS